MKKIAILFITALLLISLVLPMSAADDQKPFEEIGDIKLENKAPTIDGKIEANEGWSEKKVMNELSTGSFLANNALTSSTDLYFAYTDEGLYFAADMTEYGSAYTLRFYANKYSEDEGKEVLTWVYADNFIDENAENYVAGDLSTIPEKTPDGRTIDGTLNPPSYDTITWRNEEDETTHRSAYWTSSYGNTVEYCTMEDGSNYAFDGDVFALSLDMLGIFHDNKLQDNGDFGPQFNIGVFEGGKVKVATTRVSTRDITSECQGAGFIDGNKLTFEVMIPWSEIIEETTTAAKGFGIDHTFTKEEILAGSTSWAAVTLMDRFDDPEAGYVDDWGRNITVCGVCYTPDYPEGIPGGATSGDQINAYGIHLIIGNAAKSGTDTDANGNAVTDASGNPTSNGGSTTTKAASTNKSGNGGSSANTFDAGLAVAVGALATSALGVYFSKKRK